MAIKGYSAFPKAPALLEPQHQIVLCHIHDSRWWEGDLTYLQRSNRCILQLQPTGQHTTMGKLFVFDKNVYNCVQTKNKNNVPFYLSKNCNILKKCLESSVCTLFYDIKYSYLIKNNSRTIYGIKYFYLIQISYTKSYNEK